MWRSYFSSLGAILEAILILKETLSPSYVSQLMFSSVTLTIYSISYITAHSHVLAAIVFAFVRLTQNVFTGLDKQTHKHLLENE